MILGLPIDGTPVCGLVSPDGRRDSVGATIGNRPPDVTADQKDKKPLVMRLVPNLPRGRGRSIGGDLDVGEEGSEQTIVTLQSLHHSSVGYQHVRT
jgi:hypothetical protein